MSEEPKKNQPTTIRMTMKATGTCIAVESFAASIIGFAKVLKSLERENTGRRPEVVLYKLESEPGSFSIEVGFADYRKDKIYRDSDLEQVLKKKEEPKP